MPPFLQSQHNSGQLLADLIGAAAFLIVSIYSAQKLSQKLIIQKLLYFRLYEYFFFLHRLNSVEFTQMICGPNVATTKSYLVLKYVVFCVVFYEIFFFV